MSRGRRIFLVGLVALLTVPVVYVLTHPAAGELLTPERLAEARKLWAERRPKSYVLEVDVRGLLYRIEVEAKAARAGEEPKPMVVAMTIDGNPAASSAFEYWTVEGMFRFLSEELSNLGRPEAAFGVTDPDDVVLRAEFDARYGYPSRFLRYVIQRDTSVEWRVRSFEPR